VLCFFSVVLLVVFAAAAAPGSGMLLLLLKLEELASQAGGMTRIKALPRGCTSRDITWQVVGVTQWQPTWQAQNIQSCRC